LRNFVASAGDFGANPWAVLETLSVVISESEIWLSLTDPESDPADGVENAPVPSRNFVASFGAFGANPCLVIETLSVVTSDRPILLSVTAPAAIVVAAVPDVVTSPVRSYW
jgi:hypothetical protein